MKHRQHTRGVTKHFVTLGTDDFNQAIIGYVRKHGHADCHEDAVVDCTTGWRTMGDITVEWEVETT